jgi:hypothetical protein
MTRKSEETIGMIVFGGLMLALAWVFLYTYGELAGLPALLTEVLKGL